MNNLEIKLQNCYGIKELENKFNFSSEKVYAIYAPNGVMKTSLAKTFKDFSEGKESSDIIFPNRTTVRSIKYENGNTLNKEEIFVIEPYIEDFESSKMSTLLVNKELKSKYDKIHLKIDEKKVKLIKELKKLSGLKESEIEEEISMAFIKEEDKFFYSITRVEREVKDNLEPLFSDIIYKEIFNEKVLNFLKESDFQDKVIEYIKKYDDLIESSRYFKKGIFNHNNASVIAKNLMDNGFFKANHYVHLNTKDGRKENNKEIHTKEDLENIIEQEKQSILTNPELVKAFEAIDNKLKANAELRQFRDYLLRNQKILTELKKLDSLKQKIWISYFKEKKVFYIDLLEEYLLGEKDLEGIVQNAKREKTKWINVINIFNNRFLVPFKLIIENQDDVILKSEIPSIKFRFFDTDNEISVEKSQLLKALSSGEKRALYILNIIFEVEGRKESNQETIFVIDDIADSFDYKNKYAIIQYLKDISEIPIFYQLILTHNFDFFRTIESRKVVPYTNCLISLKSEDKILLEKAKGIRNPFIKDWKLHLNDAKKLIASIPFVRNIIEYTKGEADPDYIKLTSLLHWKSDSDNIEKREVKEIFERHILGITFPTDNLNEKVVDKIFKEAEQCLTASEGINLENKIILSIAIRLKSEKFMIDKIANPIFVQGIQSNQTAELFREFKRIHTNNDPHKEVLEEVNLMTPENIHLNSFMYEPIIDLSDQHLRNLYANVKSLS
jgi:hypothetical protein